MSDPRRVAIWVVIVLTGAWLLYPMLTPAHVEGFSASIVSLALHLNDGRLADYDRLHPFNLEYFTLSRLGTVTFLSVLTGPLRLPGEWAIRVATWLGFAALVISSFFLTRRWTHAPAAVVVVALLLIAGVAESAFFFNDTVFAAALGTTALAVLAANRSTASPVVSGLLFGAAIVTRLDAAILAPAFVLIGYEQHGLSRTFWSRALIFSIAVMMPVIAVPSALHATILDVVATTRYALVLWGDDFRPAQHAREVSLFLGIPAGVLMSLGVYALARKGEYRRLLLLAGVPVLFNVVALGKIWQSRQLLPLTPFVAALVVFGWEHVASAARDRGETALRRTVIAVCCLTWFAPILVVRASDGPRAPYGRMWTPMLWRRWQRAVDDNQREIRAMVERPRNGPGAIITDTWDGDRYLHLALQETGYHIESRESARDACARITETFVRGSQRILHLRLHEPFLPNWAELAAAQLEVLGEPCIAEARPAWLVRLSPVQQLQWSIAERETPELLSARSRTLQTIAESHYSPQVAVGLRPSDLELLYRAYEAEADQDPSAPPRSVSPEQALSKAQRLLAARVWTSNVSGQ